MAVGLRPVCTEGVNSESLILCVGVTGVWTLGAADFDDANFGMVTQVYSLLVPQFYTQP